MCDTGTTGNRQLTRAGRARHILVSGGGSIHRENSDDELGLDDHPWSWIYASTEASSAHSIVGAVMGPFSCKLGDVVMLKADSKEAWVGLICDFFEEDEAGEKCANFMWFSNEKEIRNTPKKRSDTLPVCDLSWPSCSAKTMIRMNFTLRHPTMSII